MTLTYMTYLTLKDEIHHGNENAMGHVHKLDNF